MDNLMNLMDKESLKKIADGLNKVHGNNKVTQTFKTVKKQPLKPDEFDPYSHFNNTETFDPYGHFTNNDNK